MPEPFAVVDVTLVTGDAAGTVLPHSTVLVGAAGTVEAVGSAADTAVPDGPPPVLFTRRARANALTRLHSGVTTLRTVGDVAYEVVEVAREIERGDLAGPRVPARSRSPARSARACRPTWSRWTPTRSADLDARLGTL